MIFNEETPFDIAAALKTSSRHRAVFEFYRVMANYGQLFTNTAMLQTLVLMSPEWYEVKLHHAGGDSKLAIKKMGHDVTRILSPSSKNTKLPFKAFEVIGVGKGEMRRYLVKVKQGFDLSMV